MVSSVSSLLHRVLKSLLEVFESMADLLSRDRPNDRGNLMTRPFGDFLGDPFRTFFSPLSSFSGIEIGRNENGYAIEIPVAGFKPGDIEVTLEENVLTVAGK